MYAQSCDYSDCTGERWGRGKLSRPKQAEYGRASVSAWYRSIAMQTLPRRQICLAQIGDGAGYFRGDYSAPACRPEPQRILYLILCLQRLPEG